MNIFIICPQIGSPDSVEFDFDIHSDKPPDLDTSPIIAKFIESTFNGVSKIPVRTDNCIITVSQPQVVA